MRLIDLTGHQQNLNQRRHDTPGVGVFYKPAMKSRPWYARLGKVHLGYFSTKEEAILAHYNAKTRSLNT